MCIGDAWTADIIAHFFWYTKKEIWKRTGGNEINYCSNVTKRRNGKTTTSDSNRPTTSRPGTGKKSACVR